MRLQRGRPKGHAIKFDVEQAWEIYQKEGCLTKAAAKLTEALAGLDEDFKVSKAVLHRRLNEAGYQLHRSGGRKQASSLSVKERVANYRKRKKSEATKLM